MKIYTGTELNTLNHNHVVHNTNRTNWMIKFNADLVITPTIKKLELSYKIFWRSFNKYDLFDGKALLNRCGLIIISLWLFSLVVLWLLFQLKNDLIDVRHLYKIYDVIITLKLIIKSFTVFWWSCLATDHLD